MNIWKKSKKYGLVFLAVLWAVAGYFCFSFWTVYFGLDGAAVKENLAQSRLASYFDEGYFFWYLAATVIWFVSVATPISWYYRRRFHRQTRQSELEAVLEKIRRCRDPKMLEKAREAGLNLKFDALEIHPFLWRDCSPAGLARIAAPILNLASDFAEHNSKYRFSDILNSLAEQLLRHWSSEAIDRFIKAIGEEKEFLGDGLHRVVNRLVLEKQIQNIRQQITALENQPPVEEELTQNITSGLGYYHYLVQGGSIFKKWLADFFSRFSKSPLKAGV